MTSVYEFISFYGIVCLKIVIIMLCIVFLSLRHFV